MSEQIQFLGEKEKREQKRKNLLVVLGQSEGEATRALLQGFVLPKAVEEVMALHKRIKTKDEGKCISCYGRLQTAYLSDGRKVVQGGFSGDCRECRNRPGAVLADEIMSEFADDFDKGYSNGEKK